MPNSYLLFLKFLLSLQNFQYDSDFIFLMIIWLCTETLEKKIPLHFFFWQMIPMANTAMRCVLGFWGGIWIIILSIEALIISHVLHSRSCKSDIKYYNFTLCYTFGFLVLLTLVFSDRFLQESGHWENWFTTTKPLKTTYQ